LELVGHAAAVTLTEGRPAEPSVFPSKGLHLRVGCVARFEQARPRQETCRALQSRCFGVVESQSAELPMRGARSRPERLSLRSRQRIVVLDQNGKRVLKPRSFTVPKDGLRRRHSLTSTLSQMMRRSGRGFRKTTWVVCHRTSSSS